ncbi:MAG: MvaI/BcnI family restriction endonuclease [Thiogranum sp.]
MSNKPKIYDSGASSELTVEGLISLYRDQGAMRIYYKLLSPNDNSKNQPYMAGHLTDLGFLPTGEVTESTSVSRKTENPKRKIKYTVKLDYSWLSPQGGIYPAPDAKLIYYPQYPEVRLSGFVARCGFDMGGWMDPEKKGRASGRILFFGITTSQKILAYLAVPGSRIVEEIDGHPSAEITGVFKEVIDREKLKDASPKDILLGELRRIHLLNWIEGKKLSSGGVVSKHTAQNAGGTTLEAELGIIQNGFAGPDFMGWEIKQFGVTKCELINSKALTLMTPEPDGGYYVDQGVEAFMRKYGYQSPTINDRLDFTGRHLANEICPKSGLVLVVDGYDSESGAITRASGCIALIDRDGNPASIWTFRKLVEHWKRKHAKAAYIPSLSRKGTDKCKFYSYCNNVRLFEGTTFLKLLQALTEAHIYYDPGIKLENASWRPRTKRRSQFRIKSSQLGLLYEKQSDIDVLSI